MVAPIAIADQRYTQQIVTVPAGKIRKVDVGFKPDTWVLIPKEPIALPVFYSPAVTIDVRTSGTPITGSNASTLTGVRGSRTLFLYNTNATDVTFYLTASYGLVPPVVSTLMSVVTEEEDLPLAPTSLSFYNYTGNGKGNFSFTHDHNNSDLIVMGMVKADAYQYHIRITAITANGAAMVKLAQAERYEYVSTRRAVSAQIYRKPDVIQDDTLVIAGTIETSHGAQVSIVGISLPETTAGTIFEGSGRATSRGFSLSGLDDNSIIMSMLAVRQQNASENTGAEIIDDQTERIFCYHQGKGSKSFSYTWASTYEYAVVGAVLNPRP